ncbi:uncharacterized protein LOC122478525 [Prionailurus bengalensis]|uniref:uncharacterized protein LOC122478525 n=1 Tax=Prionailurus bengalensis TaxID=37029 RepID=UPI001CA816B3|nr:uncharacterized protein LOC122478525 [Prionailurus bengalensis]
MASGAAAKRAQGERAAGRQPRPRPRPQRGADRVPPRLVPQRRTLDRGCCAPSRRRYRKLPVRNPSFQGLGRIDGGDKNAEEDSITRLSDKPGPDDSWPTSPSQGLDFGTKVKQIMEEAATRKFVHEDGSHIISFCGGDKNAEEDSITRLSDKPGPDDSWPTSPSQGLDFGTKVKYPPVKLTSCSEFSFLQYLLLKFNSSLYHHFMCVMES